jgi:hypothetical protein
LISTRALVILNGSKITAKGDLAMGSERRKANRDEVKDGVLYLHEALHINQAAQNGLAFDLSIDGACIYTQQEYDENDSVKVFCKKFGDEPIKATIRWCKKVDERLFKIGLSFGELETSGHQGSGNEP